MKEIKSFPFKIDRVEEGGEFFGYASTFNNLDLGGDVVEPGAFRKTLRESGGKIPVLDHHDPQKQIGWNLEAGEDRFGLFVRGQLNLNVQLARERHSLMKQAAHIGGKTGLSIGFRTIKEEPDPGNNRIRHLKEIQLFEYSLVSFPMNPQAAVTQVKFKQNLLGDFLKQEIGMNAEQAKAALAGLLPLLSSEPGNHSQETDQGSGLKNAPDGGLLQVLDEMIANFKTY